MYSLIKQLLSTSSVPGIVRNAWNNRTTKEFLACSNSGKTKVKGGTPMANNYSPRDQSLNG